MPGCVAGGVRGCDDGIAAGSEGAAVPRPLSRTRRRLRKTVRQREVREVRLFPSLRRRMGARHLRQEARRLRGLPESPPDAAGRRGRAHAPSRRRRKEP